MAPETQEQQTKLGETAIHINFAPFRVCVFVKSAVTNFRENNQNVSCTQV